MTHKISIIPDYNTCSSPLTAMSSSAKVSLLSCQNPLCVKFNKKPFSTQTAYTQHIDRNIGCYSYVVMRSQVLSRHGAPVVPCHPSVHEDGNVMWTSNKRASLLRRHMVTEVSGEGELPAVAAVNSGTSFDMPEAPPGVSLSFPEDNEMGSMYPGDFDQHVASLSSDDDNDEEGPSFRSKFMYTTDQKWTVRLLKILDHANAPDYTFGEVLQWARSATADGYSCHPIGGLSRSKNVDALINSVTNADKILPFVKPVEMHKGPPSDVICFDFVAQLLSLLQNRSIMTAENLVIDINDPLKPYYELEGGNVLGEALSGSVYRDAYKRLIKDPARKQLFVPIIQWIDRTSVTGNERFSLKPYMFTPAIFTEKFRRSIKAWGYHGFLPKKKASSAQNKVLRQGDNLRNYHKELHAVLDSFRKCGPSLRDVYLPIGPKGKMKVDIVTCVLFIVQDMQEGDMLCGRFGVHTSGIQRSHRCCDVNYENLRSSDVVCKYLVASEMDAIAMHPTDDETRQRWSQHKLDNAFTYIEFADPVRGIYGATPCETMHAVRKGTIEKVTKLVLDNIPPSKKAAFDDLAILFHKTHRQTHRKNYPSTDFSNGVTNLTKITANERLGLVFLFVILFQYEHGWQMIQQCLEKKSSTKVPQVLEVLESLLCFDAWLNQSHYWETHNAIEVAKVMNKCQDSVRNFMDMCKVSIPLKVDQEEESDEDSDNSGPSDDNNDASKKRKRKKGGSTQKKGTKKQPAKKNSNKGVAKKKKGQEDNSDACEAPAVVVKKENEKKKKENKAWNFPKFHELLHVVDDMARFGSPVNFCAQRPESLLIPAAKQPGRRAQKRKVGSAYELQAAQRLMYSFMIETVHTRIWDDLEYNSDDDSDTPNGAGDDSQDKVHESTGRATFGSITRVNIGAQRHYEIDWSCRTRTDLLHLPPELIQFVCSSFKEMDKVVFCTEYKRDVHTFRCHPCYQSDGPIYDWVVINFGKELGNFPCRLALVVVVDSPHDLEDKYQLVVQSATEEVTEHASVLLREWKWSPEYHLVSASTIVGPCFVISISHNSSTVLETKPYCEWASLFT